MTGRNTGSVYTGQGNTVFSPDRGVREGEAGICISLYKPGIYRGGCAPTVLLSGGGGNRDRMPGI